MQEIQNGGFSGFAEVVFLDPGANGAAPICRSVADHSLKSVSVTGIPHWGQTPKAFRVSRGVRLSDLNLLPDDPVSIPGASNRVCSVLSILIHHWWGSDQALHKSGSVSKRGCGLRRPLGRMQAGVPPVRRFSQWRRCPSSAGGLPSMGPPRPTSMRVPGLVSLIAALAPAWITDCKLRRNRRFLRLAHGIQ